MICPLCEHVQQSGDSCEECGRRLAPESVAPIEVDQVADLEPTRLAPIGQVPILPLPRLERGRETPDPVANPRPANVYRSGEEELEARCPNCGVLGRVGHRCAACGVPLSRVEP